MLGNLFEPCRPAVGEHKVRLGDPQFLLFLLRFHDCMDLRTYRCKNRSARCLITCRGSLQSGARQAARPTSAPRRLRPLRRRSRRRSLTGSTDSGSWPARPSAVQSNSQRLFRSRASHRPAAEQVRLPGCPDTVSDNQNKRRELLNLCDKQHEGRTLYGTRETDP